MDRTELALRGLDLTGRGLEFGPSHSPLVPKSSGARVEVLDHAPREVLVEKYREWELPEEHLARIDEVDHVWTGGSFLDLIPDHGAYDFLVASHFIEHTVDLIRFLRDAEGLLAPHGRLALVVPDKRYCFDRFQPLTTLGEVIDAWHSDLEYHPAGALVDQVAYAAKRGGEIAWPSNQDGDVTLQHPDLDGAAQAEADGLAQREYIDVHRWKFTPTSFELLITDLARMGHHGLGIVELTTAGGHEFFVTLAKDAPPREVDRLHLLRRIEGELADLGPGGPLENYDPKAGNAQVERLQAELADLRASTSWRVTKPLRALGALLGRGRR